MSGKPPYPQILDFLKSHSLDVRRNLSFLVPMCSLRQVDELSLLARRTLTDGIKYIIERSLSVLFPSLFLSHLDKTRKKWDLFPSLPLMPSLKA